MQFWRSSFQLQKSVKFSFQHCVYRVPCHSWRSSIKCNKNGSVIRQSRARKVEESKTKYSLKLGGLKCASFLFPARGMWEIIVVIVVILSLCKGQEVRPLHLYFCHSSLFSPCFLPFLLSSSPKQPQGKALSTQKHPWCNHICIFPKANKQFCLWDHVLWIAKLSNLIGYLKLQSLWVRYLFFIICNG